MIHSPLHQLAHDCCNEAKQLDPVTRIRQGLSSALDSCCSTTIWSCLALAVGIVCGPSNAHAQRGPALVAVKPVVERLRLAPTQTTVGTVTPSRIAVVGSAVDGRVTEMLVREGDRVENDQELARLLTETIKLDLEAAESELELKRQELIELQNGSRIEELAQTSARLEASRVVVEYREKDRKRVAELWSSNSVSASEYEDAVSKALEAKQLFAEAEAAHQLALAGPRSERIAQARAQVAIRDALVRRLSDQIRKHTMFSRFAGYVTVEYTEVGQWLARGEPVAEIVALDEVEIVAKVLEAHIPFVHVGDSVSVQVPALSNTRFEGTVLAVVPQADTRSRTFPVKILVQNQISTQDEPLLKAGMLARVELPTAAPTRALLIPKDALVLSATGTMVWAIDADTIQPGEGNMLVGAAVPVPVTTGASEDGLIAVTGDLQEGIFVVTRGNERILPSRPDQPATQVTWPNSKAP